MYRVIGYRPNLRHEAEMMANAWVNLPVTELYGLPAGCVARDDRGNLYEIIPCAETYPDGLPRRIAERGEVVDHV